MLTVKLFEVRDDGTFIPVMATAMNPLTPEEIAAWPHEPGSLLAMQTRRNNDPRKARLERERYLLRRAGYGYERPSVANPPGETYVMLTSLNKGASTYNPYDWVHEKLTPRGRTMHEAHKYIIAHWDELESGAVIDLEFILGETEAPKTSEQFL